MKEIVVTKVTDYVLCSIVYCKKIFFLGRELVSLKSAEAQPADTQALLNLEAKLP